MGKAKICPFQSHPLLIWMSFQIYPYTQPGIQCAKLHFNNLRLCMREKRVAVWIFCEHTCIPFFIRPTGSHFWRNSNAQQRKWRVFATISACHSRVSTIPDHFCGYKPKTSQTGAWIGIIQPNQQIIKFAISQPDRTRSLKLQGLKVFFAKYIMI